MQVNADKDMDSIEYGVVLSNLLDNAIEAEEQEKHLPQKYLQEL